MSQRLTSGGDDRLPWLTEVPRTEPPPAPPRKRWKFPWAAVLIGLAFAFVAAAAYWLGVRKGAPVEGTVASRTMPLEQPYDQTLPAPAEAEVSPVEEPELAEADIVESAPVAATATTRPQSRPSRAARPALRPRPRAAAPASAQPAPPVIVQPVVRGRIIQLGAYPTQGQAELAWRQLVKSWPYLATKPKLVSPIDVRSTDGRATRMHRLQLATASQAQSAVICQRLETKKQSCVVVY